MQTIALFGPTGVGKTAVALALARALREQGEDPVAVSADAMQVYAGLETLTGVASEAEQRELEHRLVSFLALDESFSAGRYARLAHAEIDRLLEQGRRPIVVGGTGLYLRAALCDLDLRPTAPAELRARLTAEIERDGAPAVHARLAALDADVAAHIEPNDRQRIVRALELAELGQPPKQGGEASQLWSEEMRRPTLLVGLTMQREELYETIDARVDAMLVAGVADEVVRANTRGASETARKALGFQDLMSGDVEAMKRRTRNYARRQLTWMRKLANIEVIDVTGREAAEIAAEILDSGPR